MPLETNSIRLLLVDDHQVVRMGLRALFERSPGIAVAGEAASVAEAVDNAARLKPTVVLMDMRLPDGTGVDACREILSASPDVGVLFLTSYGDQEAMLAAVFAGARGYLLKEIDGEALVHAVEAVAAGQSVLDPNAARVVMEHLQSLSGSGVPGDTNDPLSNQERRVVNLVTQGRTNKEIAAALTLSEKTVKNYLSNIFQKLRVTRRAQVAAMYSKHLAH